MPDSSSDLLVARRRKLEALRALGAPLYPNDFVPEHATGEVRERFGQSAAAALTKLTAEAERLAAESDE